MKVSSVTAQLNLQELNARKDRDVVDTQERTVEKERNIEKSVEKALEQQRLAQMYSYDRVVRSKFEGTVVDVKV
jgi:hypothetical protein